MTELSTTITVHENFRFGQPVDSVPPLEIVVPHGSTVLDVKGHLSNLLSVPVEKIRLAVNGRQLTDDEICEKHVAKMILRKIIPK